MTKPPFSRRLSRSLLAACIAACLGAVAPVPQLQAQTPVTLNFVDADIDVVASEAVGELTGKTFVLDPKVRGKINIQSAKGVAPGLAYPTFLSALRMAGFAAVEGPGGVVRVVPEVDAKALPTPIGVDAGGAIATKVIPLAHQVQAGYQRIAPAGGCRQCIDGVPAGQRHHHYRLRRQHPQGRGGDRQTGRTECRSARAGATESRPCAGRGGDIDAGVCGRNAPPRSRDRLLITADARSNSIIVRSEDAGRLARETLIQELDRPTAAPGNIRIVYLKHADAAQVAATLRRVLGAEGGSSTGSSSNASGNASALSSLLPTAAATGSTPQNPLAAATAALTGASSMQSAGTLPQMSTNTNTAFTAGGATVYPDTAINALVISAHPGYNNLRTVIEQLDVRRAQVFIEALIAEVQADRAAEFGIQWQALDGINRSGTQGFGGTNFGSTNGSTTANISASPPTRRPSPRGFNVGLVRGAVTIAGKQMLNLGLLARALQSDVQANILSMPTLLALDNEGGTFLGRPDGTGTDGPVRQFVRRQQFGDTVRHFRSARMSASSCA